MHFNYFTKIMLVMWTRVNLFGKINYYMINFTRLSIGFKLLNFFEFCLNLSYIHTCAKGGFEEGSLLKLFFLFNT